MSKDWKNGGVASVSQSFVRLTPDRQSKKGAVWSRKSLGTDTFSTILKFRISGQGKKFFGDGMALWVMQQGQFSRGPASAIHETSSTRNRRRRRRRAR